MFLSRRELLGAGILSGAALLLPAQPLFAQTVRERLPESRLPAPFQNPLTIPPVLAPVKTDATTDYYQITMRQADVPIVPGLPPTTTFGYNGITPGPSIVVRRGAATFDDLQVYFAIHPTLRYQAAVSAMPWAMSNRGA